MNVVNLVLFNSNTNLLITGPPKKAATIVTKPTSPPNIQPNIRNNKSNITLVILYGFFMKSLNTIAAPVKGSNPIFIDINMAIPQNRNKQATVLIMHWKVNSETFIPVPENKFVEICILFWDDILKPNNEYNLIPKPINEPNNNV